MGRDSGMEDGMYGDRKRDLPWYEARRLYWRIDELEKENQELKEVIEDMAVERWRGHIESDDKS